MKGDLSSILSSMIDPNAQASAQRMLCAWVQAEEEAAERREEEKYQEQLMARFAEEDKVEQMNAQKRRLRVEQHKREAARLIAEKQALIAAAKVRICHNQMS